MTEAVIFDLDGIVVDTVPVHFKAWKKMFARYGVRFTFEDYKEKVDGIPRIEGARAILRDLDDREIQAAAEEKQSYFREILDRGEIPVYESTIGLIRQLNSKKVPVGVISSSKNCAYILKKIKIFDLLDTVVDGTRELRGKPDPEIFLTASDELRSSPSGCAVFEDAVLGVMAAKKAGMKVIGIDRYGDPERLSEADIVLSDVSEIKIDDLMKIA